MVTEQDRGSGNMHDGLMRQQRCSVVRDQEVNGVCADETRRDGVCMCSKSQSEAAGTMVKMLESESDHSLVWPGRKERLGN